MFQMFKNSIYSMRVFLLSQRLYPRTLLRRSINKNINKRCMTRTVVLMAGLPFIPSVKALSWGGKKSTDMEKPTKSPEEVIMEEADYIYSENDIHGLYAYLIQYKDTNDAQILWRLCRAACDKAKVTEDKVQKKALMYEAFDYIKKALAKDDQLFAVHKWYAIMLDYVAEYEGTKTRISNAYQVKEHFMKAVELNPADPTSVYLLGYWCFVFADMAWYEKKVASVIFATPPSSTYEEALKYFLEAEKIEPNFYSMNLLLLGKTYLRMNNKEMAETYLTRAHKFPVKTLDDKQAHKEAIELLASIGVKVSQSEDHKDAEELLASVGMKESQSEDHKNTD